MDRKRVANVPQTHAAEVTPESIPNADALSLSGIISACGFLISFIHHTYLPKFLKHIILSQTF